MSWAIFMVLEIFWALGMNAAGESPLLNATSAVGAAAVFVRACLQDRKTPFTMSDGLAAGASLTAILIALIARDSHTVIVACVCANVIGMIPTLVKTYRRPTSECLYVWGLWLLGSMPYFYLQRGDLSFDSMATPIVIAGEEAVMVALILWRTRTPKQAAITRHA